MLRVYVFRNSLNVTLIKDLKRQDRNYPEMSSTNNNNNNKRDYVQTHLDIISISIKYSYKLEYTIWWLLFLFIKPICSLL